MMQKFRMRAGSVDTHHGRMTHSSTGPAAAGVRVPYADLPDDMRAWVDDVLGSPVVAATTQIGGFSPGVAARLRCGNGSRAFVKAVSSQANPDSPGLHRREIEVLRLLPAELPVPRLIASYDEDPWVVLVVEDVEGRQPTLPWRDAELDQMLELTRTVCAQSGAGLRSATEHVTRWHGWQRLAELADPALDGWPRRHLDQLVGLEAAAEGAATGEHLVHLDIRADNVLLGDQAWLVDWPWAAAGPRWLDVVTSAPAVTMQGGPPPEDYLRRFGLATAADDNAITATVAAFAGMLTWLASLPPPPGLPTVRAFQAAQADIATAWLQQRLTPAATARTAP